MAFGLTIKNSNGEFQIDSDYRNHKKYDSGSGQVKDVDFLKKISFSSATSLFPLVFFRVKEGFVSAPGLSKDGNGDFDGFLVSGGKRNSFEYAKFDWVAYTEFDTLQASDYGIAIFDPSGDPVFHSSEERLMNIVDVYSHPVSDKDDYPYYVNVNSADNYFQISHQNHLVKWTTSDTWAQFSTHMSREDSTTLKIDLFLIEESGAASGRIEEFEDQNIFEILA